jgi:hypothetical protein
MGLKVKGVHDLLGYLLAFLIDLFYQERFDVQAGFCHGTTDTGQHDVKGPQRLSRPINANRAKQAVFNRIPLGGARGIMTHGDV